MTKEEIEKVVDGLIPRLPVGKEFPLEYELTMYFNSILSDIKLKNDRTNIVEDVMDFMIENEYIKYRPNDFTEILEPRGIEAKRAGGHFKYLEMLEKKVERENKQDKILDLELKLKTFESKIGKKLIVAGFIITFLSFLVSVLTVEFLKTDENKNEQKIQVENPLLNKKGEIKKDSLN
ncbi:hypothetical protein T190611E02C_20532 [Tenacibaculum sp. 190524A05c]|uniref:hypothetical protein n=1 Tax=Tenacibaculum platacis TaxID=3137852 RepID=UPI0031FB436A